MWGRKVNPKIAEINKALKKYRLNPIEESDYGKTELKTALNNYKTGNSFLAVIDALIALGRIEDANKINYETLR